MIISRNGSSSNYWGEERLMVQNTLKDNEAEDRYTRNGRKELKGYVRGGPRVGRQL